ncbi:MAG: DUF4097 family beta strand repeat-containing protein [Fulvivirga sp.]|nr:DUF4097 family beta strand repeat-containing protein [Fulvivirga sp.]
MKTFTTALMICLASIALAQHEFKLDKTYDIGNSGTIYMKTDDADMTITGTDRTNVHVKVYWKLTTRGLTWGEKSFEVEVTERGGDLYLDEVHRGGSIGVIGYSREEYIIDIEAPKGVNLDIEGDDDDYIIGDINGAISLNIDDGDAMLKNCRGERFSFDVDDGDIEMDQGRGELIVDMDDGDIEIRRAAFEQIRATIDDGDLIIETTLGDNSRYTIKGDDADIVLNIIAGGGAFHIEHEDSRLYTSGNFQTLEKDDGFTKLQLGAGRASINMRVDDASIRINAQ